ncbi:efflux transporter outer membrane subunit [Massilia sp. CF038]|uniref:efflux transporter outer membrane subunit n=1 Tax=Massilia sp. CF038 TaxID=1881045 RepID=UPI000915B6A8|nr:efflux transporter outer membrane subunit [Massilia sp. CF038]SHG45710.1 multidrug efflux pump/outer membrane protein, multidrug efflux system [Massilia sp. CF038]
MTNKSKLILAPVALALSLSGCMSLAPKYERPAAPVAAAFPDASSATAANEAASKIEWQRFFADARLKELIELALKNNRDLRVAILNIEQARAQYQIRRADLLPTVGLGVSGSRTPGPNDSINSTYSGGLVVSGFELDLFGRVRSLSNAGLAQYLATEEARKATQISLIASVANAYLATLADAELLALTQQTLDARVESLKLTQLKYDNGAVSKLDLQQGLSLVDSARVTLAQTQRQRAQDLNLLTLLVGQPLPGEAASPGALALTELSELPGGLPSDLLAVRPDIRSAEQQLIAANANIGAARANFFPRITLTGSAGSASSELSGLFKSGSFGWTFAPQLVLPIFDYGRNKANLGSATAGRDIAVAQYEKSIQSAFREVADALAGQATYTEQLRAQRAVADAEAERFKLSDLRYRSGASSYLDLLDAQRSLFQAQQGAVQANLARLQNQVTLYRVLGGGWTSPQ